MGVAIAPGTKRLALARAIPLDPPGNESDAAFSKAFKRVVGANPGEYVRRGFNEIEGLRNL
jgi:hypothetical protein